MKIYLCGLFNGAGIGLTFAALLLNHGVLPDHDSWSNLMLMGNLFILGGVLLNFGMPNDTKTALPSKNGKEKTRWEER